MSGVSTRSQTKNEASAFLTGHGEMSRLIRDYNWKETSLGSLAEWPQSLRTTVNIMLNSTLPMVLLWGQDGIMIYNDAYSLFAGARHPELLGCIVVEGWPEVADFNRNVMEQCLHKGKTLAYNDQELTLYRSNAPESVWMNLNYSPIADESGKPAGVLAIVVETTQRILAERKQKQEIAERKLVQADLHDTKQMFDALFDSTIAAIAMADLTGKVLQANKTFLRLFGYTKADLKKGLTSKQLTALSSDDPTDGIYDSLKNAGEADPVEKKYIKKDGSEFPGLVGAAMLPGSNNQFMAFILDMSETERLKQLTVAKDEFVALASHQLRTPATSVKQYLGIVMEEFAGPVNSDQLQYLTIANNANDRQLTIIDDLLKTAQIDTDGYKLTLERTDLVNLTNRVIKEHTPVLDTKDQQLKITAEPVKLMVKLDVSEIATCLANLIENASKYSANKKTVSIHITKTKHYAEITVSDQGVGILKADQAKIFDKFTRVNNILSDTVSGNGLGLYWVKRIVDLHKGEISISSKIGKGTSFVIRLPL